MRLMGLTIVVAGALWATTASARPAPSRGYTLMLEDAEAEMKLGNPKAAIASLLRAVDLDDRQPAAHERLCKLKGELGKARAMKHCKRWRELEPDNRKQGVIGMKIRRMEKKRRVEAEKRQKPKKEGVWHSDAAGWLHVKAPREAVIELNGKRLGMPGLDIRVKPGTHMVTVRDSRGRAYTSGRVKIRAGVQSIVVVPFAEEVARSSGSGFLSVESRRPGWVILDGHDLGRVTPVLDVPVLPGPHTVQVRLREDKRKYSPLRVFDARDGETTRIRF